jgi:hypothetical protein
MNSGNRPISPDMPVEQVKKLLCGRWGVTVPGDWRDYPNVQEAYRQAMREAVATMPAYPEHKYSGRGVVILGGGKHFASAYVTLSVIRHVGCDLPVEVWYLGRNREMLDWQAALLQQLGATCIDADSFAATKRLRVLKGGSSISGKLILARPNKTASSTRLGYRWRRKRTRFWRSCGGSLAQPRLILRLALVR